MLRLNGGKTRICIPQNQQSIRLNLKHQLIGAVNDIANCGTKIIPHSIHIDFWIINFQVLKENTIQGIIVILTCVGKDYIKILPTFVDHRC